MRYFRSIYFPDKTAHRVSCPSVFHPRVFHIRVSHIRVSYIRVPHIRVIHIRVSHIRVPARGTPTIHDATARAASDGAGTVAATYIVGPPLAGGLRAAGLRATVGLRAAGLRATVGLRAAGLWAVAGLRAAGLRAAGLGDGWKKLLLSLLLLTALLLFFPARAFAASQSTYVKGVTGSEPTLQLQVNLDGTTKVGYWIPVQVQVSSEGASFRGTLSVQVYSSPPGFGARITDVSPWSFEEPVMLARGTQQQIDLSVPYALSPTLPRGIIATLRDQHGKTVTSQTSPVFTLKPGDLFLGLFSDEQTGFDPLNAVSLPNQFDSPTLTALDAGSMPTGAAVLQNFDVLILDDFDSSTLSARQLLALQTWVNQGGILIEVGGADWQRTLGHLPPALLPVVVSGSATLPASTPLLPVGSEDAPQSGQKPLPSTLRTAIPISTATLRSGTAAFESETILSSGGNPLIVQARAGQGIIYYLAFDPASGPFPGWPSTGTLWRDLLFRALADRLLVSNTATMYPTGPAQWLTRGGVLQMLYPDTRLALWTIGLLLVTYLLILGPVCILLLRNKKYARWGWRVALASVVVFSLLSYGLASYERGTSLVDNSISLIQVNAGGSSAHITTYMGVFVPAGGDYRVQIPGGNTLAQPVADLLSTPDPFLSDSEPPSVITPTTQGAGDTTIALLQRGPWTFQPMVAEQDRQLPGSISASLALRNNTLVGTLRNTLPASLSDVYILLPHGFLSLGSLSAGSVLQVNATVQGGGSGPLADQIAASNGLSTPYFPYSQGGQPQGDFQRHMALLTALSGAGFSLPSCPVPCSTRAFISKQMVVAPNVIQPGTQPTNGSDPLLATGTTATLIAWASMPLDGQDHVSINGSSPQGFHDNFIEMPLNITFATPARIPPDYLSGQLIGAQGSDVQAVLPSVYSATTGNLTFEFALPATTAATNGLVITVPNRLNSATKQLSNANNVQASLYNWQSGTWDTIPSASQDTFAVSNPAAYIDPGGRVLLRVSRASASGAALILARPSLRAAG